MYLSLGMVISVSARAQLTTGAGWRGLEGSARTCAQQQRVGTANVGSSDSVRHVPTARRADVVLATPLYFGYLLIRGSMRRPRSRLPRTTVPSGSSSARVISLAPRRWREATWRCTGRFEMLDGWS